VYRQLGILKVADLYILKIMYQHSKQSLHFGFSSFFDSITTIFGRQTRAKTKAIFISQNFLLLVAENLFDF